MMNKKNSVGITLILFIFSAFFITGCQSEDEKVKTKLENVAKNEIVPLLKEFSKSQYGQINTLSDYNKITYYSDCKYDLSLKKTDDLIIPYIGTISFKISKNIYKSAKTKEDALKIKEYDWHTTPYTFIYVYKDGKWNFKEGFNLPIESMPQYKLISSPDLLKANIKELEKLE